jgi:hypothetical protein
MSLINDALKRTKDVQQQTPPAAEGPALRPVTPEEEKKASSAKTFLFIMVVAVIAGNVLLWLAFSEKPTEKRTTPAAGAVAASPVESAPVAETPKTKASEPGPAAATTATAPSPAAEPTVVSTNVPEPAPKVVFTEPERPTVLRLQSIIYGSRPSAMIGGKFLSVGDTIQGHKVIAIDRDTVTLVGEGKTNVLSLP